MTAAYTPGLKVTSCTRFRARRLLPVAGDVLVGVGERLGADDIVATATLPGDVTIVNLANVLSIPAGDVPSAMRIPAGGPIEAGMLVAKSKGIFGFFPSEYRSRNSGTVENVSQVTGQMIVRGAPKPIHVRAYLAGEVIEVIPGEGVVIEADVALLQGIFGIGGEAFGQIVIATAAPEEELTADLVRPEMTGQVIIGGARMTGAAVRKAAEIGAAAIVSGGLDDADLREILGYDLGVAVTGGEQIGTTVIVTEGFGDIAMAKRSYELLSAHAGDFAAVNGATQIRAGVMRPEIVIPLGDSGGAASASVDGDGMLAVGTAVRIIRDPHFGLIGAVTDLPTEPRVLESGSRARVLEVALDSGQTVVVPRANVELIER